MNVRPLLQRGTTGDRPSASVSVVLTLYDYADRILATLDSLASQTLVHQTELVVVDDASRDGGEQRAAAWIERHGALFHSVLLLQHSSNRGLAAARNTGFVAAEADWVWVQDADNPVATRALEACHHLARRAHPRVAVVHPLLLTIPAGRSPQIFQGEGRPWQRAAFLRANCVDAMALVRQQAWHEVNGYEHIPEGWEDYNFWCRLIEAGWHGVQCPQCLGSYRLHAGSMTARTALPNVEQLERRLQRRHPWLECVGATSAGSGGTPLSRF
jgi:glycosyltransferase involved in cell wall biosynthesis